MKGYRTSLYLYTKRWIESQSIKWCVVASTAAVDAYQWFIKKQLHLFISYIFSFLSSRPDLNETGGGSTDTFKQNENKGGKKHKTIRISGNRLVFRGCGTPIVISDVSSHTHTHTHCVGLRAPDTPVESDKSISYTLFDQSNISLFSIHIHAQVI
jgi:hypothetical protein